MLKVYKRYFLFYNVGIFLKELIYRFRERGAQVDSRIISALDIHCLLREGCQTELFKRILFLLNSLRDIVAGVKIGLPTILTLGEEGIYRLLREYDWDYFFIADTKIADIGHIGGIIVEHLSEMGFDAVIIHSVIGFEEGLNSVVEKARERNIGVFSLPAMSHPGAEEILNKCFRDNVDVSLKADVDGFVLPATKPYYIKAVRDMGYEGLIISPGVGVQGAEPGKALAAGADYEIIGRSIYASEDPISSAKYFHKLLRW